MSDDVIKIGVHGPVTGAAPIPQDSFDKGKDVYWRYLAAKGGVHGRRVELVFRDDQFNPARATQVCREMVEQEKVFLLVGVAGTEQIAACANYANTAGVPYLSGGANEDGLTGLSTYFAVSQTLDQQAPIVAGMIAKELGKTKVAVVANSTPTMNQTMRRSIDAVKAAGLTIVRTSRIGKNASDSELLAEANQLRTSGAEVVFIITAPVNFIKLATHTRAQAYNPVFVGPGPSNGLNLVTEAGCPSVAGARFLSSFPQLDVIDKFDPDFRPAYEQHAGGEADDIGLLSWGLAKVTHLMFEAAGRDLSRQGFMATLTSGVEIASGVYPPVKFSPTNRFGAKASHILEADCSKRAYRTIHTFVEAF